MMRKVTGPSPSGYPEWLELGNIGEGEAARRAIEQREMDPFGLLSPSSEQRSERQIRTSGPRLKSAIGEPCPT